MKRPRSSRLHRLALTGLSAVMMMTSATSAFASTVRELTPTTIVERGRELDGTEVVVTGEAIGEAIKADGGYRWVNLLGDGTAVGLWMSAEAAGQIEFFGKHGVRGDTITARGTVNVACSQHDGEFDIHVTEVLARSTGEAVPEPVELWKLAVGAAGILAGVVQRRVYIRRRDRLRA